MYLAKFWKAFFEFHESNDQVTSSICKIYKKRYNNLYMTLRWTKISKIFSVDESFRNAFLEISDFNVQHRPINNRPLLNSRHKPLKLSGLYSDPLNVITIMHSGSILIPPSPKRCVFKAHGSNASCLRGMDRNSWCTHVNNLIVIINYQLLSIMENNRGKMQVLAARNLLYDKNMTIMENT